MPPKKQPAAPPKPKSTTTTATTTAPSQSQNDLYKNIPIMAGGQAFNRMRTILDTYSQNMQQHGASLSVEARITILEETVIKLDPLFLALQQEQLATPFFKGDVKLLSMDKNDIHGNNNNPQNAVANKNTTQNDVDTHNAEMIKNLEMFKQWVITENKNAKEPVPDTGVGTLIDFKHNMIEGVGLIAKKPLSTDQVLLSIPRELMLTPNYFQQQPEYYEALTKALPPNLFKSQQSLSLTLLTIYEKLRGDKSFFNAYINVLPKYVSNIAFASYVDILIFKGTEQYLAALQAYFTLMQQYVLITSFISAYNFNQKNVLQAKATQQKNKTDIKQLITNEFIKNGDTKCMFIRPFSVLMYRWASAIVLSRQNPIPNQHILNLDKLTTDTERQAYLAKHGTNHQSQELALIPAFDFGNHYIPTQNTENIRINTHYNEKTNASDTLALHNIKEGEQVYIYYGERPTSQFVIFQGFFINDTLPDEHHTRPDSDTSADQVYTFDYASNTLIINDEKQKNVYPSFNSRCAAVLPVTDDALLKIRSMIRNKMGLSSPTFTLPYNPLKQPDVKSLNGLISTTSTFVNPSQNKRVAYYLNDFNKRIIDQQQGKPQSQHANDIQFEQMWKIGYIESIPDKEELGKLLIKAGNLANTIKTGFNTEQFDKFVEPQNQITPATFHGDEAIFKQYLSEKSIFLQTVLLMCSDELIPYTTANVHRGVQEVISTIISILIARKNDYVKQQAEVMERYNVTISEVIALDAAPVIEAAKKQGKAPVASIKNITTSNNYHSLKIQHVFKQLVTADTHNYYREIHTLQLFVKQFLAKQ